MLKKNNKITHSNKILSDQNIYTRQLVDYKIEIPFSKFTKSNDEYTIDYAKKKICNKCYKQGYISDTNIKIVTKTAPMLESSKINYDVLYEFDVFSPYEGMELYVKVNSITKIGIKAVISENNNSNPVVVFASRMHNDHIIMNDEDTNQELIDHNKKTVSTGDIIKINVIGHRYEINDPSIYILGIII